MRLGWMLFGYLTCSFYMLALEVYPPYAFLLTLITYYIVDYFMNFIRDY